MIKGWEGKFKFDYPKPLTDTFSYYFLHSCIYGIEMSGSKCNAVSIYSISLFQKKPGGILLNLQ